MDSRYRNVDSNVIVVETRCPYGAAMRSWRTIAKPKWQASDRGTFVRAVNDGRQPTDG